ncbi:MULTISPECIES: hypothetical protein [unclassified Caulobacter]|uniref:hypothetical protein n=1 Tax=unclassified Caulobacter TaxID=2648921 RepID=UPI0006F9D097|nr:MULTISPECIES: hypothetical protein [unclassified Caulobacter]KQV55618.1 hypothetical protein ASC62_16880 [Caulobacter sp. Root342]KQV63451.1 hypothetical protein ASC70_20315 [Caulobacter sp. Root343]
MESRRRKFYGSVRLWQSNTYRIYLCAAIGAIPVLLALAWATPYTEKIPLDEVALIPGSPPVAKSGGAGPTEAAWLVQARTAFPAALSAQSQIRLRVRGAQFAAEHSIATTVVASDAAPAGSPAGQGDTLRVALAPRPDQDQEVMEALRHGRRLDAAIVLPPSNILRLLLDSRMKPARR